MVCLLVSPPWSIARVAGYTILAAVAFYITQLASVFVLLAVQVGHDPGLDVDRWADGVESNGLALSVATISTAVTGLPLVRFLAGRRDPEPWRLLGITRSGARSILVWSIALAAFVAMSDALTLALGRPLVPEFMVNAYSTSDPALLLVALVVAAPLFEEVFFRGFLLGALQSSGVSVVAAALVSALAWALIHIQYDAYGLATIFAMGLLFAAARVKTGSILPCVIMHALANATAFFETISVVGSNPSRTFLSRVGAALAHLA